MLVNQAYRYELKPNNVQKTSLLKHAGTARFAWNWDLAQRTERIENLEGKERFTNGINQHREWNVWKRENAPWWTEISKCVPQESFRDLDKAFDNFFKIQKEAKINPVLRAKIARAKPRKDGKPYGYPKFKKKGIHDSFRLTGTIHVRECNIQLPRLRTIRVKEGTSVQGRILSATISREADRWFVSLNVERERPNPVPVSGPVVGVDLGLDCFAVQSDGERIYAPKPLNNSLNRLQRASKKHSRKQNGSSNRRKSAMGLARLHRCIRNQRRDFLHKITTKLAKTKSVIVVEDLNIKGMAQNGRLSRHISDAGWGEFCQMIDYKTEWYGSRLVTADRWFPSSRKCSVCGYIIDKLSLSVRKWQCPQCVTIHDRDYNASVNLERTGSSPGSYACGDSSGGGTAPSRPTSYGSKKQEANTFCPIGIKG